MATQTTEGTIDRAAERAERFRRVAGRRTNVALKQIELLMRTANRGNYGYTEAQVGTILGALREAVDQLEASYAVERRGHRQVNL